MHCGQNLFKGRAGEEKGRKTRLRDKGANETKRDLFHTTSNTLARQIKSSACRGCTGTCQVFCAQPARCLPYCPSLSPALKCEFCSVAVFSSTEQRFCTDFFLCDCPNMQIWQTSCKLSSYCMFLFLCVFVMVQNIF